VRPGGGRPGGAGLTTDPLPGGGPAQRLHRLFVAVDPSPEARDHLADALAGLAEAPGGPRWTAPGRWHLTLLFLGAVPDRQVGDLAAALGPQVRAGAPRRLLLAGAGRFGSVRRPQVAWIGVDGDVPALADLAGRLAAEARALRLEVEERPFRPHLTVGRWRPGRPADGRLLDRLAGYRGPEWPVREVRLLESRPGPRPAYEELAAWPLPT
jgi:RNA 2',3'-cyclic 3'-phosphodiesterase